MKRLTLLVPAVLMLVFAATAPAASAPVLEAADYPANSVVKHAEASAKAAATPCLAELKGGHSADACARYHAAVLVALDQEHRRFAWCRPRMSEASNFPAPASCFAIPTDLKLEAVAGLERKVAPKAWVAFDNQMAKFSN